MTDEQKFQQWFQVQDFDVDDDGNLWHGKECVGLKLVAKAGFLAGARSRDDEVELWKKRATSKGGIVEDQHGLLEQLNDAVLSSCKMTEYSVELRRDLKWALGVIQSYRDGNDAQRAATEIRKRHKLGGDE